MLKKLYYFPLTRETVVARDHVLAAAFYFNHYAVASKYTLKLCRVNDQFIVGFITIKVSYAAPLKHAIYLEPEIVDHLDEGTIRPFIGPHRITWHHLKHFVNLATFDQTYTVHDEIIDIYYDVVRPLMIDFPCFTGCQFTLLAEAIRDRRDKDAVVDLIRTLLTGEARHYYLTYIMPVICEHAGECAVYNPRYQCVHCIASRQFLGYVGMAA